MEEFELALKGLSKFLMDIYQSLVDKGRVEAGLIPETPNRARGESPPIVRRTVDELTPMDKKILDTLQSVQEGITLRDLAKLINHNWQTIVRPVSLLVEEGYLNKERKLYGLPGILKVEDRRTIRRANRDRFGLPKPKPLKLSADQRQELAEKVLGLIANAPEGITLPEMGQILDRNWQSLKDIVRELIFEDRIIKIAETKTYLLKK